MPATRRRSSTGPWQRGFDHYFGIIQGGADYFRPKPLTLENENVPPGDGFYTTDAFVDHAIQFIGQGDKTKPFFLYLAFNAPHFPLMAPAEEIAKFRGKYKIGWDALRQQRHARQIELGIMDKAWPLSPRPPAVKAWDSLSPDEQDRFDHIMAIYAAVGRTYRHGRRPAGGRRCGSAANSTTRSCSSSPTTAPTPRAARTAASKATSPARPARRSLKASRGRRSRTRRCGATSISTTKAASPRR